MEVPEQAADERGLAGAVGAEQAEDLAGRNGEGHVVDGGQRAKPLGERGDSDGSHVPRLGGFRAPVRIETVTCALAHKRLSVRAYMVFSALPLQAGCVQTIATASEDR